MAEKQIEVLLYGLGAIGSFYAFILSRSKRVRLTVVARSNYEAVKENGLRMKSQNHGEHLVHPYKVVKTPAEAGSKFDYIVCANKAIDLDAVPQQIGPAVDEARTSIVIIQNGVGNEDPFREAFPGCSILSCVTWVGGIQNSPGIVNHTKSEDTEIGIFPNPSLDPDIEEARLKDFTSLLKEGGTPFRIQPNIQISRWEKVVWNCAWNSLTTLTMLDTHTWLSSSAHATPMTRQLMREVIDVSRASGVPVEYDLIERLMEKILAMPPIGSSMQTDCKNGRPMEVELILGTPYRKGKEAGVSTPTLDVIYVILVGVNVRLQKSA